MPSRTIVHESYSQNSHWRCHFQEPRRSAPPMDKEHKLPCLKSQSENTAPTHHVSA